MVDLHFTPVTHISIVEVYKVDVLVFQHWNILNKVQADGELMLQRNILEDIVEEVFNSFTSTCLLYTSDAADE